MHIKHPDMPVAFSAAQWRVLHVEERSVQREIQKQYGTLQRDSRMIWEASTHGGGGNLQAKVVSSARQAVPVADGGDFRSVTVERSSTSNGSVKVQRCSPGGPPGCPPCCCCIAAYQSAT